MNYLNINNPNEKVSFSEAVFTGMPASGGLYFPENIPKHNWAKLKLLSNFERTAQFILPLVEPDITLEELLEVLNNAFNFNCPLINLNNSVSVLELFHGPTLAFKDFGARFLAAIMEKLIQKKPLQKDITILTATSGDTGAAVGQAFYKSKGIRVIILYPADRISAEQEALIATLDENIIPVKVNGDFDLCQSLVKSAFADDIIREKHSLTSANSINACRLIAQIHYYLLVCAQIENSWISVPSGNFGNLTAGLIARCSGAPISGFIAAQNNNNPVHRFFNTGDFKIQNSIETLSSAMDVSNPSNWPRIQYLHKTMNVSLETVIKSTSISDTQTQTCIQSTWRKFRYVVDPHTAVGLNAAFDLALLGHQVVTLSTAHPAKFKAEVQSTLNMPIPIPEQISKALTLPRNYREIKGTLPELLEIMQKN